jgi:hypothetical protein
VISEGIMNRFDAQGEHGNYEFEAFDGAEYEGANFGEAEFGEGEFEDEWGGRVRDHRRADAPQTTVRVRGHRRPAAVSRTSYTPTVTSRSRSYAPRSAWWGTRTNYGSRPVSRSWSGSAYRPYGQQYRWGQPGVSSQWYRSGQYPGRYWQFGQGQSYYGGTPQWGGYWGRRRRRYPYGQFGYGGSAYAQPYYDEPAEPPYEEPPMPPPQAPMPPPETPPADPNAATPPQAQAQAKAEEFFIQPEAFEFDMESPGYEGESFESGFGEFESGPGTLPDPPVDKNPVNGCGTRGRPFDDFEFRSAAIPAKHGPRIKELARIIVASWVTDPSLGIRTVCLEGHTDDVGTTDENMRLGLARAKNLRAKLQQAILDEANKTGFGPQIAGSVTILVSSRGKDDPVAPNTTALGRRRNRRVRFAFST